MDCFFRSAGLPVIGALVNLSVWGAVSQEGCDLFEETARLYREWNLPVFYPLVSLFSTEEMLAASREPLAAELPWLYLQPEMQGMAEPVLIACRDGKGRTQVLPGRAGHFAGRAARWMRMRGKRNGDKRVALILHNAVCSGVEATIGQAYGLDAFESTAAILKRLKEEGYQTGVIPETGRELYDLIRERKAMSDFRWTAVEDIVEQGGCLYRMDCEKEYAAPVPGIGAFGGGTDGAGLGSASGRGDGAGRNAGCQRAEVSERAGDGAAQEGLSQGKVYGRGLQNSP